MNRLFVLRHAKTIKTDEIGDAADLARMLLPIGVEQAQNVGARLAAQANCPHALDIIASPSIRTTQTARIVQDILRDHGTDVTFHSVSALYDADASTILDVVRDHAECEATMIVGHNPGLYHATLDLAGDAIDKPEFAGLGEHFPPSALAEFVVDASWRDLAARNARLVANWHG